jgi:HTH-type transcriptional regulator/antitoxin HigA
MKPKVIRTEAEHRSALARIDSLMDAEAGTSEGDELDLWATLVHAYEGKKHAISLPDPIEAIKVRMQEEGLARKDMIRYLGSASRVSEVLSGSRPLSVNMMRRLHEGLGIPAALLLRRSEHARPTDPGTSDWARFPLAEMIRRGWIRFDGTSRQARDRAEELMRAFVGPFDAEHELPMCARQRVRDGGRMDAYALCAWKIRAMHRADAVDAAPYLSGTATEDFLRDVVRLSCLCDGPRLAREFLAKNGVRLVVERHLPKTYLDGAAFLMPDGRPVIALTLRYDRLDNFWFTLAHELAHVALHLDGRSGAFFDDLDAGDTSEQEREANRLASEALIPVSAWTSAHLTARSSPADVEDFARRLRISPAIPAGRIRHESRNHRVFWRLLGKGRVRKLLEAEAPMRPRES